MTRLDPGVHWDWIELGRLYQSTGRLADAQRALQDDRDRSVAFNALGEVLQTTGDGALAVCRKGLALAETLAAREPENGNWPRDLSISLDKIDNMLRTQGDGPGALAACRQSLALAEMLAGWRVA